MSDGRTFVFRELESETVQDVDTATSVPTAIALGRLAKVMEESRDGDAVGRQAIGVREHILIHFKGVLRKAAIPLVMAVTATPEVV